MIKLEILGHLEYVRVFLCRKVNANAKFPHHLLHPDDWDRGGISVVPSLPIVKATSKELEKAFNTLEDLDERLVLNSEIGTMFILTDGKNALAIDTQGYDYPRYKSYLEKDTLNKVLKLYK